MNVIKPIETSYNGYKFRSRLEARWAVLFDQLNVKWQYEAEGYETPFGRYVPDFWLPEVHMRQTDLVGVLFEVKPESYTDRVHNELAYVGNMNKCAAILSVGWPSQLMGQDENLFEIAPGWDNCMGLAKCSNGHVRFDFCQYLYDECDIRGCKKYCGQDTVAASLDFATRYRFW